MLPEEVRALAYQRMPINGLLTLYSAEFDELRILGVPAAGIADYFSSVFGRKVTVSNVRNFICNRKKIVAAMQRRAEQGARYTEIAANIKSNVQEIRRLGSVDRVDDGELSGSAACSVSHPEAHMVGRKSGVSEPAVPVGLADCDAVPPKSTYQRIKEARAINADRIWEDLTIRAGAKQLEEAARARERAMQEDTVEAADRRTMERLQANAERRRAEEARRQGMGGTGAGPPAKDGKQ